MSRWEITAIPTSGARSHSDTTMATRTKRLQRPRVETGAHPIETTRYLLSTPSIAIFLKVVCQWISNRATGGMVHGPPRFGKTWAIKYLTLMLAEKFGANLPILTMSCLNYTNPRERRFFEALLRAPTPTLCKS